MHDRTVADSPHLREAILLAAQIVVCKDFLETYQTAQLRPNNEGKNLSSVIAKIGVATGNEILMASELRTR